LRKSKATFLTKIIGRKLIQRILDWKLLK